MYVCMYVFMCVYVRMYVGVCMYVYVRMYVVVYVCMYVPIFFNNFIKQHVPHKEAILHAGHFFISPVLYIVLCVL